jgi:hypothetical protein
MAGWWAGRSPDGVHPPPVVSFQKLARILRIKSPKILQKINAKGDFQMDDEEYMIFFLLVLMMLFLW